MLLNKIKAFNYKVFLSYVPSHNGILHNEICDQISKLEGIKIFEIITLTGCI